MCMHVSLHYFDYLSNGTFGKSTNNCIKTESYQMLLNADFLQSENSEFGDLKTGVATVLLGRQGSGLVTLG